MHILVIEDEQRVADLLKRGLEEHQFTVEIAFDGAIGRKLLLQNEYDVVIMDIILPQVNGLDLCKQIREVRPHLPIIMLTALGTTDDKIEGLDAGADDYLVKPFDFRELLARIRNVTKRNAVNSYSNGYILKLSDLALNLQTMTATRDGKEINLTPKEFKLLEYMMRNKERVLTRAEIAEKVWDTTFDTGTNFIDVYINYLRKKIDKDHPVKLIHTKPGLGFILKEN
ncbi:DNA-binding response regulator, OmpR family, contains REC and winged-helix (wHTH) domain [Chitinophaga terrae (ex Kim and Jung 2007)]|uniref:DNA-binding response regulator, OmpR family, contains REC and winged-helix (WHTH) domain n=1 Tax=Chitinophaga terrae (ex Kim and Jung 2007) TaxID=408074 RepID=A0A1H4G1F3_9BACT|nr:response regulator transcription factor [Chitinophaga terrae (ex Kim and Jung 2007)]MDQ0108803.1 DNA-binding response OmpR family regulator [Chitinophaga terrae (ex Kim and Jung 2007)]GEP93026.1 DNA-binding response regulator [Chitinophaga terrae (ex Kim and Jung 2007)]SEB03423.1 DNA-binding response regulator, OmpR family, contains REC and winged-helix (wHTH) domain [Chitinophaga terrae (ex Kim and Jung 2007)]